MKVTMEIDNKELLFINVPEQYKNFKIVNYGFAGVYIMETDSKELNNWKMKLPNGNYEIIGFAKFVSAEKLKEGNFILRKK